MLTKIPSLILLTILVTLATACSSTSTDTYASFAPAHSPQESITEQLYLDETEETTMTQGTKITFETTKGTIVVQLFDEQAPLTTANFKKLVEQGFYDGLAFHRYEPGFVIQGGDPLTKGNPNHPAAGTGGSDETIPLEITSELKHEAGVIAMARSQDPNSASSQFYFTLAPAHFLDGNYAVFGKVTGGMDVVLELRKGDVMEKVTISS